MGLLKFAFTSQFFINRNYVNFMMLNLSIRSYIFYIVVFLVAERFAFFCSLYAIGI